MGHMYVCIYIYVPRRKNIPIYKSISILNKHYSQRFYLSANSILGFFFNYLYWIYWINLPPH